MPTQNDTEQVLREAAKARADAQAQMDELQAQLHAAQSDVEASQKQRENVAHAAMVGKNPTARKALDKHTDAFRKAQDEVSNLELALKEAQRLHDEADQNFYEADADHRHVRAQQLAAAILDLDREIDAVFETCGAKFGEREALLDELKDTGTFDGTLRIRCRINEFMVGRMLAHIVSAPDAHPALVGAFPNVHQFRVAAATLTTMDQSALEIRRQDPEAARAKTMPTAVPGSGDKRAAGILDDERYRVPQGRTRAEGGVCDAEGYEVNPQTGRRVIRYDQGEPQKIGGATQDEMAERARATQPPPSGSGRVLGEVELE